LLKQEGKQGGYPGGIFGGLGFEPLGWRDQ
jgi:hypothetical protein